MVIEDLYKVIADRKENPPEEGSYTAYLFSSGTDKILKKVGEECSETIIAAKNGDNNELANEISDLMYHLLVLMVQMGLNYKDVENILIERTQKIGNLKNFKNINKNS